VWIERVESRPRVKSETALASPSGVEADHGFAVGLSVLFVARHTTAVFVAVPRRMALPPAPLEISRIRRAPFAPRRLVDTLSTSLASLSRVLARRDVAGNPGKLFWAARPPEGLPAQNNDDLSHALQMLGYLRIELQRR